MKIRYTIHALERMKQRGINRALVEGCLEEPDKVHLLNDVYHCIKRIEERVLVVVYRRTYDGILVITAFLSSKNRKYLA